MPYNKVPYEHDCNNVYDFPKFIHFAILSYKNTLVQTIDDP
jgi:hypothetical protein